MNNQFPLILHVKGHPLKRCENCGDEFIVDTETYLGTELCSRCSSEVEADLLYQEEDLDFNDCGHACACHKKSQIS